MSHIRNLETFIADPERLLDRWEAGGADGLVLGPLLFGCREPLAHNREGRDFRAASNTRSVFDPDPRIYARSGVAAPAPPGGHDDRDLRRRLHSALERVLDRGWQLWLFDPFIGALAGDENDNAGRICDPDVRRNLLARMLDTAAAFPEATGFIVDGPAWGFEITDIDIEHMRSRRRIFELPRSAAACSRLGFDRSELTDTQTRLDRLLHTLTPEVREAIANGASLEDLVPGYGTWLRFRTDSLSGLYADLADALDRHPDPRPGLAVCPRTPALGATAGYDYARVGKLVDVVMPKLYYWQRGYDGLIGTAWRWASTLTAWNPGLSVADACQVTRMFFGDAMPVVKSLLAFDRLLTPDYLRLLTSIELGRATDAVAGNATIVPWVDGGRAPHDGDPIPAAGLEGILGAARYCGVEEFTYFNSTKMSPAEWTMLSHHCGQEWHPLVTPDWFPPDQPTR